MTWVSLSTSFINQSFLFHSIKHYITRLVVEFWNCGNHRDLLISCKKWP